MEEVLDQKQKELTALEYIVQYFDFQPCNITDTVGDFVKLHTEECIHECLEPLAKRKGVDKTKITDIRKSLASIYETAGKIPLGHCLEQVEKLFEIPSHVVLPEDRAHLNQNSSEIDINQLDIDTETLLHKYEKLKYLEASLEQELEVGSAQLEEIENKLSLIEKPEINFNV